MTFIGTLHQISLTLNEEKPENVWTKIGNFGHSGQEKQPQELNFHIFFIKKCLAGTLLFRCALITK